MTEFNVTLNKKINIKKINEDSTVSRGFFDCTIKLNRVGDASD